MSGGGRTVWLVYSVSNGRLIVYGLFRNEANADKLLAKFIGAQKQRLRIADKVNAEPLLPMIA